MTLSKIEIWPPEMARTAWPKVPDVVTDTPVAVMEVPAFWLVMPKPLLPVAVAEPPVLVICPVSCANTAWAAPAVILVLFKKMLPPVVARAP